jgi:hypothetical protein
MIDIRNSYSELANKHEKLQTFQPSKTTLKQSKKYVGESPAQNSNAKKGNADQVSDGRKLDWGDYFSMQSKLNHNTIEPS